MFACVTPRCSCAQSQRELWPPRGRQPQSAPDAGSRDLLPRAQPQPWPGCAAALPLASGGRPWASGALLPIGASFCSSPAAGGLGWGNTGLPLSAGWGGRDRASHLPNLPSTWQVTTVFPSDPFSSHKTTWHPPEIPLCSPCPTLMWGPGAVGHRPGPGQG